MNEDFTEDLQAFTLRFEFGKRKCRKCEVMKRGMYVVAYGPNGYYKPVRTSECMQCAKEDAKRMLEKITMAAKNPESYVLAAKL